MSSLESDEILEEIIEAEKIDSVAHPWPYLSSIFAIKSVNGMKVKLSCLLCVPKPKECCASLTSLSNLRTHIKRAHPHDLSRFNKLCEGGKKRKSSSHSSSSEGASTSKQRRIDTMVTGQLQGNANLVSQTQVDNLLMKFITEGLMPFSLVEQPAFKEFVTGLQPNRTVMCRATLVKKISEKASQVKRNLRTAMDKVDYIATTTDCWSARRRSYIGVTAHWIDSETLQRKSCVLACRRLMGKHTFDLLAARLEDIHTEFEIRSKVVKTTTDNGSNFVKAFSVFSVSSNSEEDNSDEAEDPGENGSFENVFDDLTEASKGLEYQLPPHHRCSAHTLNLISTVDADKAEADPSYKRLSRSTFAKCQALWNKSSRSPQAAEKVKELCGLNLIKPNATRWNSVFMSVQRLNRIIKEKGENVVHNVCLVLEVSKYVLLFQ